MAKSVLEQVGVEEPPQEQAPAITVEEPARPEWLPDNFETPEALAKSYAEAQRTLTQANQRSAELEKHVEQLTEWATQLQAQSQRAPDSAADPLISAYEQAMEAGDWRQGLAIQAQVAQQVAQQQIQAYQGTQRPQLDAANQAFALMAEQQAASTVEASYGVAWSDVKAEVGDMLQAKPYLIPDSADPNQTASALVDVAEMVLAKRARENGLALPRPDSRATKLAAQTMTGQSGRPAPAEDAREELIAKFRALPRLYGSA